MGSQSWMFLGGGKQQSIVLKHQEEKGIARIFINEQLFLEDLNIPIKGKEISFLLDDELCHIRLSPKNRKWYYQFRVDRDANTKKSAFRKTREKKLRKFGLYPLIGFIVLVIGGPIAIYFNAQYQDRKELEQYGKEVIGKIVVTGFYSRTFENSAYSFYIDNKQYTGDCSIPIDDLGRAIGPLGLPILKGDEFTVRYSSKNPAINSIDLEDPSQKTLVKHLYQLSDNCQQDKERFSEVNCNCLIQEIYGELGIDGLADFYFREESFIVNTAHNSSSFEDMIESAFYQQLLKRCAR